MQVTDITWQMFNIFCKSKPHWVSIPPARMAIIKKHIINVDENFEIKETLYTVVKDKRTSSVVEISINSLQKYKGKYK